MSDPSEQQPCVVATETLLGQVSIAPWLHLHPDISSCNEVGC